MAVQKQLRWRVLAVAGVVAVAVGVLWPPADTIRLGLDLRGGVHLVLRVRTDEGLWIFERIKEELPTARGARAAVAAGFDRVFLTILDTHVTSLIAAAFLYQFGSGPIRGFATTLFFGLVSNVFTAVFVSRTLFGLVLTRRRAATLSI